MKCPDLVQTICPVFGGVPNRGIGMPATLHIDRARLLPQARPPWRSPRDRRQRTERFLIYTLQRHEHVQRGFGPTASVELVRLAARDRSRHREARNAVCSRRRTWRPNFRECLALLSHGTKAGFEREIGFGGFEHLAAASLPSRQRRGLTICRQSKCQKV